MGWKKVSTFLKKNGEAKYKSPTKCDGDEQKYMEQLRIDAKETLEEFERLALQCCEKSPEMILIRGRMKNFLDGSMQKIRPYTWERFSAIDAIQLPINLSLFCERSGLNMQARAAIDIDLKKASYTVLNSYNKTLLSAEKPDGSVYLANSYGNKNLIQFEGTGGELLNKIALGEYKKAEIAYIFPIEAMSNDDIVSGMQRAVNSLVPIYKKVVSLIK